MIPGNGEIHPNQSTADRSKSNALGCVCIYHLMAAKSEHRAPVRWLGSVTIHIKAYISYRFHSVTNPIYEVPAAVRDVIASQAPVVASLSLPVRGLNTSFTDKEVA